MTFRYTDPDGDQLEVDTDKRNDGTPVVYLAIDGNGIHVPLDRIEELIAGLRDTRRQAARTTGPWRRLAGIDQHDDYRETTP